MMLVIPITRFMTTQEDDGKGRGSPEISHGRNERLPDKHGAQLEILRGYDDGRVDRTAYNKVARERKPAEPHAHRALEHEQSHSANRETEN